MMSCRKGKKGGKEKEKRHINKKKEKSKKEELESFYGRKKVQSTKM